MMLTLIRKLLRDLRVALAVVALLLGAFQCLWYKVTERIIAELSPFFSTLASLGGLTNKDIQDVLFAGPGKIIRTLVGGDQLDFDSVMDMSAQVELAEGDTKDAKVNVTAGVYELSLPLNLLGLTPDKGQTLRGDVGLLRGNGFVNAQHHQQNNY